jgi:hypothetical protein
MTGKRWRAVLAIALLGAVLAASAGCSAQRTTASSMASGVQARAVSVRASALDPAKLPPVTGGGVRALWQGAPWGSLTFDGGTLLGVGGAPGGKLARVHAISAATGKPLWTANMPESLPEVLGLVPAGNVVVVEAGHPDDNSVARKPIATEYVALDIKTGRTAAARALHRPTSATDSQARATASRR